MREYNMTDLTKESIELGEWLAMGEKHKKHNRWIKFWDWRVKTVVPMTEVGKLEQN